LGAQKSWSYTLQKWLALKMLCNQIVTHNGFGQEVGFRDKACLNPSFSLQSLPSSNPLEQKLPFKKGLNILFTGHLSLSKGADIFIETAALVCSQNMIPVRAVLIGPDTDESPPMHLRMQELQIAYADKLEFICTGWQNHTQMIHWLEQAHFMILPSMGEGWPKVLSEGMAYGCVPISSAVSTVDRVLSSYHTGCTVAPRTALSFAETINVYISSPGKWELESKNAFSAAKDFTYERWYESLPFKQLSC
jgi:glycosyltransferase involved in cell wall biosynthesis